jgi:preprotein translocase subunit SecG
MEDKEMINGGKEENKLKSSNKTKWLNKKLIAIVVVSAIFLIALILIVSVIDEKDNPNTTSPTYGVGQEDVIAPTAQNVNDNGELKDKTNRPTFTINGVEYTFGCQFSEVLKNLEIENVQTFLWYNREALIIQPGKTREWTMCDEDRNKCYIEVYNPTKEELSSEYCLVRSVMIQSSDMGKLKTSFIGGKIKPGMQAKSIVDVLGKVSGRKDGERGGCNSYWWNWAPYKDNADYIVYVKVETNQDTGEITKILVVDKTITK